MKTPTHSPVEHLIVEPLAAQACPTDEGDGLIHVDMLFCPGGQTTTRHYPVLEGREVLTTQLMLNPPPITSKVVAHTISVTGIEVTVSGGSEDTNVLVLMR